ncbi:hypothetical protein CC80DRAFT_572350 [Byssothecium circinans]|uniref:RHD3-domain-containing protein n=1 Tax=Byssothecium circinans TaxID=147558 RepID=A0A6A5TLJ9_9PLEO|nr:hypothetical protein CC80DRAFT_572350 [Byssothecium circinans]
MVLINPWIAAQKNPKAIATPPSTPPTEYTAPATGMDHPQNFSDGVKAEKLDMENTESSALPRGPLASNRKRPNDALSARVKEHDPNSELLPNHPNMQRPTTLAEDTAFRQYEKVKAFLEKTPYRKRDKIVDRILAIFEERKRPDFKLARVLTVVTGESGKGKSSTMNSLLGKRFCSTGKSVQSVTNVMLRFRNIQGSKHVLQADVFIHEKATIRLSFEQRLAHYHQFTEALAEGRFEEQDAADGQSEMELLAQTAVKIFSDLFAFTLECQDIEKTEEFLNNHKDHDILDTVEKWLDRILVSLQKQGLRGNKLTFKAATMEGLLKLIQPFAATVAEPFIQGCNLHCCPYPIVDLIDICYNSNMLKTGNELADVPGIGDVNRAHVDRAQLALLQADKVMVVGDMDRSGSHTSIMNQLHSAFKKKGSRGVFLVLTKSEDIGAEDDKMTKFTPEESRQLEDLERQIEDMEATIDDLRARKTQAFADKAYAMYGTLEGECVGMEKYEMRVRVRNRATTEYLQTKYKNTTKDPHPLEVFCISNTEYEKYMDGYPQDKPPKLSLEGTGVPALRKFITLFPANGRFATLKHHVNDTWDSLISTLEMAGSDAKVEQKEQLDYDFSRAQADMIACIEGIFALFKVGKIEIVKKRMADAEEQCKVDATEKLEEISEQLHFKSHEAVMANFGTRTTLKSGEQNWNQDFLEIALKTINIQLNYLRTKHAPSLRTDLSQRVGQVVDELVHQLDNNPKYDAAGADSHFRKDLRRRKTAFTTACTAAGTGFLDDIGDIHDIAKTESGPAATSYFGEPMRAVYLKANKAKRVPGASTLKKARTRSMATQLRSKNGPFHHLQTKLLEALNTALDKQRDELLAKVAKINIDPICSTKGDDSEEYGGFREGIDGLVPELKKVFEEEVRANIRRTEEMCK